MRNVFIQQGDRQHLSMYLNRGWCVVSDIQDADLVHFTGGEDVSPSLYGQKRHILTRCSPLRDKKERAVFLRAMQLGIPMVGECRGAQFLNVMSGGALYQHVDGHAGAGTHMMVDVQTGAMFPITSTHHQMMRPSNMGEILGIASESSVYESMDADFVSRYVPDRGEDVEVVYYRHTNALCFQGHPEYMAKATDGQEYFFNLIEEKLYDSPAKEA